MAENPGQFANAPARGVVEGGSLPAEAREVYCIGDYRIIDDLGTGGMATVHLARKDGPGGFQKWAAIKRIHRHLAEDETFVLMFLDEARVAARISHPNVASVFDLGEHDHSFWLAMEYLHGETLRDVMRRTQELRQPMPPEIACRVIADAADGLHAAHEARGKDGQKLGVVHRDVTPHNLFVTYEGTTKVVDFGIAKFRSRMASTRVGTVKGKLAYMSPEQVQGDSIDRRTDVFALGIVLWELTTGQRLFGAESDVDTLTRVQRCAVPLPSSVLAHYPTDLEQIVMRALAHDKEDRFATARELSRALQTMLMRRGTFVSNDEVGAYMSSIFEDRIATRDAYLHWASELTGTAINAAPTHAPPSATSPTVASPRQANPLPSPAAGLMQGRSSEGDRQVHGLQHTVMAPRPESFALRHAPSVNIEHDPSPCSSSAKADKPSLAIARSRRLDDLRSDAPTVPPPGRAKNAYLAPPPAPVDIEVPAAEPSSAAPAATEPTAIEPTDRAHGARPHRWVWWIAGALAGVLLTGAAAALRYARPTENAATDGTQGRLSVICLPPCREVFDNGHPLGPSPIHEHRVRAGTHRLELVGAHGNATKTVHAVVTAGGEPTVVREPIEP